MEVMFMKSVKKKLSIIALAASILGCKSAMAVSPFVSPSISAGQEYFNGKKKSGRNDSDEKSKERGKVDISSPIPTLDDLKILVPVVYGVANEIAGDFGWANRAFFGKHTVAKAARSGAQYAAKKIPEFVDYLKNKLKTSEHIKNQRSYDESLKIKRETYYYENLEKVLLHFGVDTEISKKLVNIMNIQQNSDGSLSYDFLNGFSKNGQVPFGYTIDQKIIASGFRAFVNNLRGKCKLDIDGEEILIFGDARYAVKHYKGFNSGKLSYHYDMLRVTDLNSKFYRNGASFNDYAEFFWKTNYFGY